MASNVRPNEKTPHLKVQDVSKTYRTFAALDSVSLDVMAGEFLTLLGPSGSGKTTLLRAIAGLDQPTSGRIWLDGENVSDLPVEQRDVGIVFQSYALFPNLRVHDNVAYGLRSIGMKRQAITARVEELLRMVDLADQAAKYPNQLSGGQQQRVALARALAPNPKLLLLDEPLSALDARVRLHLRGQIRSLQRKLGITTIMVTHDQEEALTLSDRVAVMNRGRIEQIGSPADVYERPATRFVANFVGAMNFLQGHLIEGRLGAETIAEIGGARVTLARRPPAVLPGMPLTLCIRPEDVEVAAFGPTVSPPNSFPGRITATEFLGHRLSVTLELDGTGVGLAADLSNRQVTHLSAASPSAVQVVLPPERLLVFPGAST